MTHNPNVYGYVNGKPVFSRDEFIFGLDERDTYTTKHEIDDLVTVVHITREEAPAWQH